MVSISRCAFTFAVPVLLLGSVPLAAQTPDDCYQATLKQDDREIIRICSAALEKGGLQGQTLSITLSNRGLGYLRNKEYDKSIIDFSESLLINPKNPYAFNSRGEAWREKGNIERALADFNESIRVDPTFAAAFLNRGITYERQGDKAAARNDYEKALSLTGTRAIDKWARDNAKTRLANLGVNPRQDQDRPQRERYDDDNTADRNDKEDRNDRADRNDRNDRQDNRVTEKDTGGVR